MAHEVLWLQANPGDEALVAGVSARQDRQLLDVLFAEGVVDVAGGDFAATEHATLWKVTVAPGRAVITGDDQADQGKYLATMTTAEDVQLNPPPGADKRIDLIYYQVKDPNAGGGAGYTAELGFVEGVVNAAPVAPAVPASAIALCSVLRESTDVTWADASITDLRDQSTLALEAASSGTTAFVGARAYASASTTMTNAAFTVVNLAGESYDSATLHDTATNPSRITVPDTGKYLVVARIRFSASAGGSYRAIRVLVNGIEKAAHWDDPGGVRSVGVDDVIDLTAGDYVQMAGYQDVGSDSNVQTGATETYLTVVKVG